MYLYVPVLIYIFCIKYFFVFYVPLYFYIYIIPEFRKNFVKKKVVVFCWILTNCKTSISIFEEQKTNFMSLAILFHLCAQHVSDFNVSIISSLRLFCWITTLVILFLVRCVLEFRCGWVGVVSLLQAEAQLKHTSNQEQETIW